MKDKSAKADRRREREQRRERRKQKKESRKRDEASGSRNSSSESDVPRQKKFKKHAEPCSESEAIDDVMAILSDSASVSSIAPSHSGNGPPVLITDSDNSDKSPPLIIDESDDCDSDIFGETSTSVQVHSENISTDSDAEALHAPIPKPDAFDISALFTEEDDTSLLNISIPEDSEKQEAKEQEKAKKEEASSSQTKPVCKSPDTPESMVQTLDDGLFSYIQRYRGYAAQEEEHMKKYKNFIEQHGKWNKEKLDKLNEGAKIIEQELKKLYYANKNDKLRKLLWTEKLKEFEKVVQFIKDIERAQNVERHCVVLLAEGIKKHAAVTVPDVIRKAAKVKGTLKKIKDFVKKYGEL